MSAVDKALERRTEQHIQIWNHDGTRSYSEWHDDESAQEAMSRVKATEATLIPTRRQVGAWEIAGDARHV